MVEEAVTTGDVQSFSKIATTNFFTGRMPFLLPNQRVTALKGNVKSNCTIQSNSINDKHTNYIDVPNCSNNVIGILRK